MAAQNNIRYFVDPVCQMKVTKYSEVPPFVFRSCIYYFCDDLCRKVFTAEPEMLLESNRQNAKAGRWSRFLEKLNKATGGKLLSCH